MLFNTPQYLLFLLVILVMLWITNKWTGLLFRNTLLLVASYYFYANLHIGFVGLLVSRKEDQVVKKQLQSVFCYHYWF